MDEKEYKAQNKIFKDRLDWQRTCLALMGMQNDFLSKENKKLKKDNQKLRSEIDQLRKEKKRLLGQIQKILGVTNQQKLKSAISNDDEEETPKGCQDKKTKIETENRVSHKMEPIYKGIEYMLRQQEVLHADETGWRMDAQNWYLWIFCNKRIVYFHLDKSRGSKVPKSILGEDFDGVVHADFYAAYNFLPKTQRCLFHLLRDIKDELKVSPEDNALIQLDEGIKEIIQKGQEIKKIKQDQQREREEAKGNLENTLQNLTQLDSQNQKTSAFIKRINKYQDNLLRFVDHAEIEYHNNRAERGLRHSVPPTITVNGNRLPTSFWAFHNEVYYTTEKLNEMHKLVHYWAHHELDYNLAAPAKRSIDRFKGYPA